MRPSQPSDHPLRAWRLDHKLSLEAVAEKTASTAATISRIENDKQIPSYRLIRRLGAITGIDRETFLNRLCDQTADDGAPAS